MKASAPSSWHAAARADEALRRKVESLLAEDKKAGHFIESPADHRRAIELDPNFGLAYTAKGATTTPWARRRTRVTQAI